MKLKELHVNVYHCDCDWGGGKGPFKRTPRHMVLRGRLVLRTTRMYPFNLDPYPVV